MGFQMNAAERNYAIVTAAYWGFTLTDGALRMLVLLHFYKGVSSINIPRIESTSLIPMSRP